MKKTMLIGLALLLAGCSHNFGTCVIGKGLLLGQSGIQYFNGVAILDCSRENSGWKIEVKDDDGLLQTEGQIKGLKSVERKLDKQVSGYLVDLSKHDKKSVQEYLKK